jgi:hypothetical protein
MSTCNDYFFIFCCQNTTLFPNSKRKIIHRSRGRPCSILPLPAAIALPSSLLKNIHPSCVTVAVFFQGFSKLLVPLRIRFPP